MSRSFRHTPKRRYDGCQSEKQYRILRHQQMRAAVRQRLQSADYDEITLPHQCEAFNDWDCGKSGRTWFDPNEFPDWMRK